MDEFEEYYTQCGEMYLTVSGNIVFHCLMCENIYKRFEDYAIHTKIHYQEYIEDEISSEAEQEEQEASQANLEDYSESIKSSNSQIHVFNAAERNQTAIKEEPTSVETINIPTMKTKKIIPALRSTPLKPCTKVRKFKCPYCDYACPDKGNLIHHAKRHSVDKKHKCNECTKAFHTSTELRIHMRVHTGEKPFLCTECGLFFVTSSRLSEHRKRHFNIRNQKCTICGFACFNRKTLREHMTIHSDERSFKCQLCEASFKRRVALWNHVKIHENKKEYACKLCGANFNQHAGLYSHMKSIHAVEFQKGC